MSDRPADLTPDACPLASKRGPRRARRLQVWTFVNGDEESEITIPHTWNDTDATDGNFGYERGAKQYMTEIESEYSDGRQFLHFEGANQWSEVEIDGDVVGSHNGGYTAFTYDVTEHLSPDDPSTVEVTVDNTADSSIPPLSGDFTFYGGLYRPVWFVETSDVHVIGTDHGSVGIFVDTPTVSTKRATVRARTTVINHRDERVSVDITHRVVDETNSTVATFESDETLSPDSEQPIKSTSPSIEDPRLWTPDDPQLYTLVTEITEDGEVLDRLDCEFGIRQFDAGSDGRVYLNGEPITLRGTSRHQDRAGEGNALSREDHIADIERIAATGANFLRLAHYPQSQAVLHAANREGLVLWEEVPVVDRITNSSKFVNNCHAMIREMVRQHYNHPSVGMWGFMNEILMKTDTDDPEALDAVTQLATDLYDCLTDEDPTRPTAMACHFTDTYEDVGLTDVPDILGWNIYIGWYDESVEDIGTVLDDTFGDESDRIQLLSEYGAGADIRLHTESPEPWDFTEEFQRYLHEQHIAAFDERPGLAGTVQWNAFDFSAPVRDDTIPDVNQKGLMTFDRRPKATYHLYRAWLSDDPIIYIATRNWQRRVERSTDASDSHSITVYSNLPAVELEVAGQSLGTRAPDDGYAATWGVSLEPGENELVARAVTSNGTPIEDHTSVQLVRFDVTSAGGLPAQGLAINVGSHRDFVTPDRVWAADRTYATDACGWGYVGGMRESDLYRLFGTDRKPLYQDWLEGLETYRLDVPPGEYRIECHFCEPTYEESRQRVFDISANGESVVEGFDLVADAGLRHAISVGTTVTVEEDNPIRLDFDNETGNTLLNALLVEEQ